MAKEVQDNILSQDRKKLFASAQNRDRAKDFIGITAGDDNGVFFYEDENTIASCCAFSPLSGISGNDVSALQTMMNTPMPADTIMQFIQMGSPFIDQSLSNYVYNRQGLPENLPSEIDHSAILSAQYAVRDRALFLRSKTKNNLTQNVSTVLTQTHCFWTIKVPLKKPYDPFNERDFNAEVAEFIRLRNELLGQLSVAGMNARVMLHNEVLAVLRRYFKIYDKWDDHYDEYKVMNEQIFLPGTRISWGHKNLDTIHISGMSSNGERQNVGMLVINRYPGNKNFFDIGAMLDLLGDETGGGTQLGCPYTLTTTIYFPDQAAKATKFRKAQMLTVSQAKPLVLRWSKKLQHKLKGFNDMEEARLNAGGNIVEATTTLMLFHTSTNHLNQQLSKMKAYYESKKFIMGRERYIHGVSFFNNLPMNSSAESIKNLDRFHTMMGMHVAHILPILHESIGIDDGINNEILLTTRRGRLFKYSLFSEHNLNYNWTMIAGSGAGKSFFTQRLTQDALSLGTKVWTIDTGSSYLAAAKTAGAQIIDFHLDSDICLNPFTHIADLNQEVEVIAPILAKMARPNQGCNDSELNILKMAVRSVFDAMGNKADIDAVIAWLNNQSGDDAAEKRKLAQDMVEFGSLGSMGKWFKGKNNFEAKADWTVIELSGLITNKHLCDVVLMIISTVISQEMFLSRGNKRKKMLIIEEGGDRITDPSFAEFISKLYSKVRKEDGSVGVVTQTFNQIYATKFGKDIMESAYTKFFMQQNPGSVEAAINGGYLQRNPYLQHLLEIARTERGRFSEVIIWNAHLAALARLIETPRNRVLFATDGELFKTLQAEVRAGRQIDSLISEEAQRRYPDECNY